MLMTKNQRQDYAKSVMTGLEPLMPAWEGRVGRFRSFQSVIRCKRVADNCLCFGSVTVSPPRGTGPNLLLVGVGWTDEIQYDETNPIEYTRPSGVLSEIIYNDSAPEWEKTKYYVGLEHLKRRGGVFAALNVGLSVDPEDVVECIFTDFSEYGMRFLNEMCRRRGYSLA